MDILRTGHFIFESGYHGDTWIDLDRLVSHPRELRHQATRLAGLLADYPADLVCGPLEGGAFVAECVAAELGLRFGYARREPGPRYVLSTEPELAGLRAILVDDAINQGSATLATATELQHRGCEVVALGSLLVCDPDGPRVGAGIGVPQVWLTTVASRAWPARDCPLCAAGSSPT